MKSKTARGAAPASVILQDHSLPAWLTGSVLFGAAVLIAFIAYAPSMNGDFVFDDRNLPMFLQNAAALPLGAWLHVRPLLMATYYLNFHAAGLDRFGYHALNVVMHAANSVLIFFAVRRLLQWTAVPEARLTPIALFAAALFLLHPLQTEAVSYIASRSETLSVLFFLAAFNVFLYRRRSSITFGTSAVILVLYACAMTSKEHTAVFPAVLLLTDYFFNPGFSFTGIRRNWRLYGPIAVAGLAGVYFFTRYIGPGSNLGFNLKGLTWWTYLLTEFRAAFVYLRLLVLPYGQTVDYNFPVSAGPLDHGAILYGLALLALIAAAVIYRRRFPLASYGFLVSLILFAPTSSIVPIRDTLAERRMYLPFIGLALILCEIARRLPWKNRTAVYSGFAVICLIGGLLTFRRNEVWVNMESLWRDAVSKDPGNARAMMGLGDAYALGGRCADAIPYFERGMKLEQADYRQTFNLASAFDCANRLPEARVVYLKAIQLKPAAEAWVHIAVIDMKSGRYDDAFRDFQTADQIDPAYVPTFNYRGVLYLALSRFDDAGSQFSRVLAVDPLNEMALRGMDRVRRRERQY